MEQKTVAASEFKAKCLALLDEVAEFRHELVVTKRGRAVARILPVEEPVSLLGTVTYCISDDELVHGGLDWTGFAEDE